MEDTTAYKLYLNRIINDFKIAVSDTNNIVYTVDTNPVYIDGAASMYKFLAMNIRYPSIARENGIQGKVVTKFIIDETGNISNLEIVRSVGYGLEEEAIRVISLLKKWTPAVKNGKNVKTYFFLPVTFKLA